MTLLYLWLPSPEAAIERVARRVAEGGHDVPAAAIVRRYRNGAANLLNLYLPLVDSAAIYDNDDTGRVLIAERELGGSFLIQDRA